MSAACSKIIEKMHATIYFRRKIFRGSSNVLRILLLYYYACIFNYKKKQKCNL